MKLVDKVKIGDTVRRLADMLVAEDYDGIKEATQGRRLAAEQLRQAVEEYGRELQMPPEVVFHIHASQILHEGSRVEIVKVHLLVLPCRDIRY